LRVFIVFIIMTLATSIPAVAQSVDGQVTRDNNRRGIPNLPTFDMKPLHFGFLIGFNTIDFHIYNTGIRNEYNDSVARYGEILDLEPGINLGIVTDLRLTNHLNLRCLPGVGFGQRNVTFIDEYGERLGKPLKIKSTFVELPLLVKYSAYRMKNVKPYLVAGNTFRYDLARDKQSHLKLHSFDAYWDLGAGFDFYLAFFRLSVEFRASFGLTNIFETKPSDEIDDIPFQQAIDCMKSRWYGLTFYFE